MSIAAAAAEAAAYSLLSAVAAVYTPLSAAAAYSPLSAAAAAALYISLSMGLHLFSLDL